MYRKVKADRLRYISDYFAMSRSALWRQEGAKKMREKEAEDLFMLAVNEGRNNPSRGLLPLWGPDDAFHLNPVLLEKIIKSSYFQKYCRDITNWSTLVDEIYYSVKHLEPWDVGGEPSVAFCLLTRLMTLRCTEKQMKLLLDHVDSPYIRGVGFLYLRFVGEPRSIFRWIEPYFDDDEPIEIISTSKKRHGKSRPRQQKENIGGFVRRLFSPSERDFYGTTLPRLPSQVERDLEVKIHLASHIEHRAKKHLSNYKTMDFFKTLGSKVMALYGDEENPVQWYEAVVDRVVTRDDVTSRELDRPKFVVTFPEYGNTEIVRLGEMEMKGVRLDPVAPGSSSSLIDRDFKNNGRYRDNNRGGYYRKDKDYDRRDRHYNYNRNGYSKNENKNRSFNDKSRNERGGCSHSRCDDIGEAHQRVSAWRETSPHKAAEPSHSSHERKLKRSTVDNAASKEKKRKLLAKYG